jgi:alkylation response protein AidB-like acyl-CoA dehydrogenase
MVRLAGDCDFTPSIESSNAQLVRKTLLANAVKESVDRAIELVGGAGFYTQLPFERMWRDVRAAHYHALPEKKQHVFTGRHRLGIEAFWDV